MVVREFMTKRPISADVAMTIGEVLDRMMEINARHIPIVNDDNELVGIVSDRDLRDYALPVTGELDQLGSAKARLKDNISRIMSGDVISVHPESEAIDVIDIMTEERVGAVPVVDPASGKLQGIVSYIDILRAARDVL